LAAFLFSLDKMLEGYRIIGKITDVEVIAVGRSIRILNHLNKVYGSGRWRKLKGIGLVEDIKTGEAALAEIHWFEAHGIGKRLGKIKRWL
jgi:hypothetical protein